VVDQTAVFRAVADFGSVVRESKKMGSAMYQARQQVNQFNTSGAATAKAYQRGMQKASAAMVSAGTTATIGLSIPIAAVGRTAIRTFAEFEMSIAKAGSKTNATAKEMEAMRDISLQMGNTTKFTARESAEALDFLAAAGFNAREAVDALPGVVLAAQAANESLGLTTQVVAKSMNAFGLAAKDSVHVADVLSQAANMTTLDMQALKEGMGQVGEIGPRFNQSLEDTVAMLGRLHDQGVPAASAGTAIRQALTSLATPTLKASNLIEDLGIKTRDANGQMLPLPDLLNNVRKGIVGNTDTYKRYSQTIGMSDKQLQAWAKSNNLPIHQAREIQKAVSGGAGAFQDFTLKALFGVEGAKAFALGMSNNKPVILSAQKDTEKLTLLQRGLARTLGEDGAAAWIRARTVAGQFTAKGGDAVRAMSAISLASDGVAKTIGEAFSRTTLQKVDNLRGAVETFAITIISKAAPTINSVVDSMKEWVTGLTEAADAHPGIAKAVVALAAAVAVLGPAMLVGGAFLAVVAQFRPVFTLASAAIGFMDKKVQQFGNTAVGSNSKVQGLVGGVGRFANFMGGPWGIAIGLGVALLAGRELKQKQAAAGTKSFTDSLTFQKGALDINSQELIANRLAKDGTLDAARKAGIAEKEFVAAILAGGGARQRMIKQLQAIADANTTSTYTGYGTTKVMNSTGKAAAEAAKTLRTMGGSLDASARASRLAGSALGQQNIFEKQLQSESIKLKGLQLNLADAQRRLKEETNKVIDAFTVLKGGTISSERASIRYKEALAGITRSAKENGKSLSENTTKGRANRTAFLDAVDAINEKITADFQATAKTKGLTKATDGANKSLKTAKADLRAQAKAAGFSKSETDKMIREMLKTPKELKTSVKTPGLTDARRDVKDFDKAIENTKGKTIGIKAELAINTSKGVTDWNKALTKKYGKSARLIAAREGGGISGPGTATSDSIPMLASDGEHMWTAKETEAAGGHKGVAMLRAAVLKMGNPLRRRRGGAINNGPGNKNGRLNKGNAKLAALMGEFSAPGFKGAVTKHGAFGRLDDLYASKALAGNNQRAATYFADIGKLMKDSQTRSAAAKKAADAAKAASMAGGNGGYTGPVGSGGAGIRKIARSYNPSYIAAHRDPQGGPAFDIGSSGAKNSNIANALRSNHGKLGLRYVISRMRIASGKGGWGWRRYSPIASTGDFRHVNHVHVSYRKGTRAAQGGWAMTGEQGPELTRMKTGTQVLPYRKTMELLSQIERAQVNIPGVLSGAMGGGSRPIEAAEVIRNEHNEFVMPIYYPKKDELPTRAAQQQLVNVAQRRVATRRTRG